MRIAYIAHYFPPAGFAASINTYEIVNRLLLRAYAIDVFTQSSYTKHARGKEGALQLHGNVSIIRTPEFPPKLSVILPHIVNTYKVMRAFSKYELIMTQFHTFHFTSLSGSLLKSLRIRPWIARVHDIFLDPSLLPENVYERTYYYGSYKANLNFLKEASRILVLTSEVRNLMVGKGFLPENMTIVPNGVDPEVFAPALNGFVNNQKTILYVGAMQPEDGLEILIEAFSMLDTKEKPNMILVGDGVQKPLLEGTVKRYGLKDRVIFLSYVPHEFIPSVIKKSYLTIGPLLPSPLNSYTVQSKILEYFACGKPVISTQISKDAFVDGVTGLVLRSSNPRDLSRTITSLLEDEKLSSRLGKNARKLALEKFDWKKIIDSLHEIIHDVAG